VTAAPPPALFEERAMHPRERIDYSAIVDRAKLPLPGGARLIVWSIVNVEDWPLERPMPRQVLVAPTGVPLLPDIANWSWHEYGMRVGFWRLKAALEHAGIIPTLSINASVCVNYPRVARAALEAGWEFMGHGFSQIPTHQVDDQRAMIRKAVDTIRAFTGKQPVGWLGPGLTQTLDTVDHLAEAGIRYIGDWVLDDQPCEIRTRNGPLVTLPYTLELNDIAMMVIQHHAGEELLRRATDQFDRLYAEGAESARVMAIAVHPYISGVPHRIGYFEKLYAYMRQHDGVLFWTGEQILDWYQSVRR
jgi:allantoinase